MTNLPFFSIIIPLYNKEVFIENTLNCVINQYFTNFEVIIVNDGSTDKSVDKISTFTDPRITLMQQENQGASVARNTGIENANGKYIAFLDADDFWKKNHLEELYKTASAYADANFICSRYVFDYGNNKLEPAVYKDLPETYTGYVTDFFKSSMVYRVAQTSAIAIKKVVFVDQNIWFNPNISSGQDLDLFIRVALHNKVAITNAYTLVYNFNQENHLSQTPIYKKRLIRFEDYLDYEKENTSLKKFLDLYRVEYALHFQIFGYSDQKKQYLKNVDHNSIDFKTVVLLNLPSYILKNLLKFKIYLRKKGFYFSVYH